MIRTAVPFLLLSPDARAGAMGEAGAALSSDANSIFWNPGKVSTLQDKTGFSFGYMPWLPKFSNIRMYQAAGYHKLSDIHALALGVQYFDYGKINLLDSRPKDFAIDLTYSRRLSDRVSLGVTGKYIRSEAISVVADGNPDFSVAGDIGLYYNSSTVPDKSNFGLAVVISNIGNKIYYDSEQYKDFLPANLRLGSAYTAIINEDHKITVGLDLNKLLVPTPPEYVYNEDGSITIDPKTSTPVIKEGKNPDRGYLSSLFGSFADAPGGLKEELQEVTISSGVEYLMYDIVALRGGYFNEPANKGNRKYFTVGAGGRYEGIGLDLSYLIPLKSNSPLDNTYRISAVFNIN